MKQKWVKGAVRTSKLGTQQDRFTFLSPKLLKAITKRFGDEFANKKETEFRFASHEEVMDYLVHKTATRDVQEDHEERLARIEEKLDTLATSVDHFAKKHEMYEQEHGAFLVQTRRYDRWFQKLAKKTEVKLEA